MVSLFRISEVYRSCTNKSFIIIDVTAKRLLRQITQCPSKKKKARNGHYAVITVPIREEKKRNSHSAGVTVPIREEKSTKRSLWRSHSAHKRGKNPGTVTLEESEYPQPIKKSWNGHSAGVTVPIEEKNSPKRSLRISRNDKILYNLIQKKVFSEKVWKITNQE